MSYKFVMMMHMIHDKCYMSFSMGGLIMHFCRLQR